MMGTVGEPVAQPLALSFAGATREDGAGDEGFLGLGLQPLLPGDGAFLAPFLAGNPQPLSGYTYPTLFAWAGAFRYRWGVVDGTVLVSCRPGGDAHRRLLQPVGPFPPALQERLLREAARLESPLRMVGLSGAFLSRAPAFMARFEVQQARDGANYVYRARDLATLAGPGYTRKRNHLAQARRAYSWTVEPLTQPLAPECLKVADDIARQRSGEAGGTREQEELALVAALSRLEALGLSGLLVRVDGQPAAFSVWDRLGPDTAVVLFERALRRFHGMYQVVNLETAQVLSAQGFEFVNREEDLGDPGLRKAKLSYSPARLEMSYAARLSGPARRP